MADTPHSKCGAERHAGSSPARSTSRPGPHGPGHSFALKTRVEHPSRVDTRRLYPVPGRFLISCLKGSHGNVGAVSRLNPPTEQRVGKVRRLGSPPGPLQADCARAGWVTAGAGEGAVTGVDAFVVGACEADGAVRAVVALGCLVSSSASGLSSSIVVTTS